MFEPVSVASICFGRKACACDRPAVAEGGKLELFSIGSWLFWEGKRMC